MTAREMLERIVVALERIAAALEEQAGPPKGSSFSCGCPECRRGPSAARVRR